MYHFPLSSHTFCSYGTTWQPLVNQWAVIHPLKNHYWIMAITTMLCIQNQQPLEELPIHGRRHMPNVFLLIICCCGSCWRARVHRASDCLVSFLFRDVIKCETSVRGDLCDKEDLFCHRHVYVTSDGGCKGSSFSRVPEEKREKEDRWFWQAKLGGQRSGWRGSWSVKLLSLSSSEMSVCAFRLSAAPRRSCSPVPAFEK